MKKLFTLLSFIIVACFSFVLTSCNENTKGSLTVTDMSGREVSVNPGKYEKIACIGAGALRLYCYVGDVSKLCAVEDIDNESLSSRPKMFDGAARPYVLAYGEEFKSLESCGVGGPQNQAPDKEKLLLCDVDLVISEYANVDEMNELQDLLGVPVIVLKYGSSGVFDQTLHNSLKLLGKVLDKETKANTLVDFINNQKSLIEARVANVTEKPKTYICGLGNWGTTNHLQTSKNYAPFNVANILNVVPNETGFIVNDSMIGKIDDEKFAQLSSEIDIMIIDSAAIKNIKTLYKENPNMFDNIKAYQTGEVYLQMAYNAYYTNVELALVNTWYNAKVVYPTLFSDIDMTVKTNEVTQAFLGKDLASQIFAKANSFGGYQKVNLAELFA